MRFSKGDKVFYHGREVEISKPLPNSNRYRITSEWCKDFMVNEDLIFGSLEEYHKNLINFSKERIIKEKERFEKSKEYLEKRIKESQEFLKNSNKKGELKCNPIKEPEEKNMME